MPIDIYKKTLIVAQSDEHIMLNALGGRLVAPDILDRTTNNQFGATIDAVLANTLLFFRNALDAQSGDGRQSPRMQGLTTADGQRFNVLPGGKPEIASPRIEFKKTEAGLTISGTARNMAELERLAGRKLSEYGVSPEALKAGAKAREEYAPMLHANIEFNPETWRALVKMACNLLAHQRPSLFLEDGFDAVRDFVRAGHGDSWDFVATNTMPLDLGGSPMGQLDHLIVVTGDSASGVVRGFIALYEHLQFVMSLGTAAISQSFVTTYRVNQLKGVDRLDAADDQSLPMPEFNRYSEAEYGRWLLSMKAGFDKIMPIAMERMRAHALNEMIEKSHREVLGTPDGMPTTPEQIRRVSQRLAERVVTLLAHEGAFDEDEVAFDEDE